MFQLKVIVQCREEVNVTTIIGQIHIGGDGSGILQKIPEIILKVLIESTKYFFIDSQKYDNSLRVGNVGVSSLQEPAWLPERSIKLWENAQLQHMSRVPFELFSHIYTTLMHPLTKRSHD